MKKRILSLAFIFAGCNGMNSELRSPFFPDAKVLEKPRCSFKIANNCWQRSLDLLMACVPPIDESRPAYFSPERYRCSNQTQGGTTEITFSEAISLEGTMNLEGLSFRIYNDLQPCFQFTGRSDGFVIDANLFGTLQVQNLANGDTRVSCFNSESYTVTAAMKTLGCLGQDDAITDSLPQVSMRVARDKESTQLSLSLSGTVGQERSVFQCHDLPEGSL